MATDLDSFMKNKKQISVKEAIEGVYTFWDNEYLDNPSIVGYLALYSGNYYFTYLNHNELNKSSKGIASKFCFTQVNSGKYTLEYRSKIDADALISQYDDNEILATITFDAEKQKNTKTSKTFLIRTDKDREHVYFHSIISELQLWNISKAWKNDGISDKEAIKTANAKAIDNLKEVNESEFAKSLPYKFKVEDYRKKVGLITVTDELYWYILYTYTFKLAAKNEIHFAGHPAHFTIRVNQKSGSIQFLHGE